MTGSMHLVETNKTRLLLDCGLTRGRRDEARQRNGHFPFDPATIDAVVLSHAHVDHCGNLPNLVRQGFHGPIYCTAATRDLVAIMLADSARIQEEEAVVAGLVGGCPTETQAPLYTRVEAERTVLQCVALPYGQCHVINDEVRLRFVDAGHILGSAMTSLTIAQGSREYRITFTGDLGRRGLPFLRDPSPVPDADLIICESTYGGRVHETAENMAARMSEVVRRTRERGGKVLIPAFSLGRTQIVLHYLQQWMQQGILPRLPLYVDSPVAEEVGQVYQRHASCLQPGTIDDLPPVHYLHSREESRQMCQQPESSIVVASGGMCDGGRITQYLRHYVDDPRSSLVLVSYQAPHSLGAQLLERRPTVRFHGRTWNKWIEVVELKGFSGHADHNDFLALLSTANSARHVRLVHGEPPQAEALAAGLRQRGFADVAVPHRQDTVDVS